MAAYAEQLDADIIALQEVNGETAAARIFGEEVRLLSIHLKAFCFDNPLATDSRACMPLSQQLTALETWIDEQAAAERPFLVLGDFNRRLNELGDEFWFEIDDANPPNADLTNSTAGLMSQCWDSEFPSYIDHIVSDRTASQWLVPNSFQQILFTEPIAQQDLLSDHCPIAVILDIPGADAPESALSETQRSLLERIEAIEQELRELRELIREMDE